MVKVSNLQKTFWAKTIFNWADLALWKKEIAWLVGINWVWKTTLFNVLSWEDNEFEWSVVHDTKHPLIGYMKQNLNIENSNISILEFLKKYTWIENIETELNELMSNLDSQKNLDRYWDVYEMFEKVGGYEFEYKIEKLLGQMYYAK